MYKLVRDVWYLMKDFDGKDRHEVEIEEFKTHDEAYKEMEKMWDGIYGNFDSCWSKDSFVSLRYHNDRCDMIINYRIEEQA